MADEIIVEVPQLTIEEQMELDISNQLDAEQIVVQDLTLPGTPIKHITIRSKILNKQVIRTQKYYQLEEEDGTVIGYQRWEDEPKIQTYGTKNEVSGVTILGKRKREKVI